MTDYLASILRDITVECDVDYVGIWEIVGRLRWLKLSNEIVFNDSMFIIGRLLENPGIIVGQFANKKFCKWEMKKGDIITKIEREWVDLGRDPDLGEIVWFVGPWAKDLDYPFK